MGSPHLENSSQQGHSWSVHVGVWCVDGVSSRTLGASGDAAAPLLTVPVTCNRRVSVLINMSNAIRMMPSRGRLLDIERCFGSNYAACHAAPACCTRLGCCRLALHHGHALLLCHNSSMRDSAAALLQSIAQCIAVLHVLCATAHLASHQA